MSTTITESNLRFEFSDPWVVLKYDEHLCYRAVMEKLKGTVVNNRGEEECWRTTAVDVVATRPKLLLFLEIKDFRGHRIQTKTRVGDDLAVEVAVKTRDTLAGLVGGFHRNHADLTRPFVERLLTRNTEIRVLLWLETDAYAPSPVETKRQKSRQVVLSKCLKQRCAWLTSRALVVNLETGASVEGMTVKSLAGAGRE
ncbi:MAG TPA: hypothetical protein PLL20_05430 [Phycisphaerae bacterium]|nr:hypothetical protein [Phycisphaerae bacterium]HRR83587.1 hypothetical protein [Phycisphaerae bacterium]